MKEGLNDADIMRMVYTHGKFNCEDFNTQYSAFVFKNKEILSCAACSSREDYKKLNFANLDPNNPNFIDAEIIAINKLDFKYDFFRTDLIMYLPVIPGQNSAINIIDSRIEKLVVHKQINDFISSPFFRDEFIKLNQKSGLIELQNAGIKISYVDKKLFPTDFKIKFRGQEFSP